MCKQHQYASYYYICFHSYSYITQVSTDLYQSHNASYIRILYISNKIQTSIHSYDLNTHHSHILIYIHMCLFNHALQAYAIHLCITCLCFPFYCFYLYFLLSYTCMSFCGRALPGNHHSYFINYIYHHEESPIRESLRVNHHCLLSHPRGEPCPGITTWESHSRGEP